MSDQNKKAAPPAGPTPDELRRLDPLGRFLEENRAPERRRAWRLAWFASLALLVVLNFLTPNPSVHFGLDAYPGFWPIFSFVTGSAMIVLVKKIVQPLIKRPEDYYGDL